jgi:hypothetical protein
LEIQLTKKRSGSDKPVVVRDPINKKEKKIPLTGCHWRSNYQKGEKDPINRLSLEIQLTKRRFGFHQPFGIGDPIKKKEVIIPFTGCHWRSN